jgi:hypothetical protein
MARGAKLAKVHIANDKAGNDHAAKAKPNHSKISPK